MLKCRLLWNNCQFCYFDAVLYSPLNALFHVLLVQDTEAQSFNKASLCAVFVLRVCPWSRGGTKSLPQKALVMRRQELLCMCVHACMWTCDSSQPVPFQPSASGWNRHLNLHIPTVHLIRRVHWVATHCSSIATNSSFVWADGACHTPIDAKQKHRSRVPCSLCKNCVQAGVVKQRYVVQP